MGRFSVPALGMTLCVRSRIGVDNFKPGDGLQKLNW